MISTHVGTSFDIFRTGTVISEVNGSNNITRKRVMFAGCFVRMRGNQPKYSADLYLKKTPTSNKPVSRVKSHLNKTLYLFYV